jgi:hypothetical protein
MDDLSNLQPRGVNPHGYRSIDEWEMFFHELGLKFSRSESWYWGPADFLAKEKGITPEEQKKSRQDIRKDRPDQRTLARPFEATFFKFIKPVQE